MSEPTAEIDHLRAQLATAQRQEAAQRSLAVGAVASLNEECRELRKQNDKLDAENAELASANADLNDEVHGLRQALADAVRQLDDARDIAIQAGAFTSPGMSRADLLAEQYCWARVGSRPSWMSPDQYDPCNCRLPKDHEPVSGPGTLDGHCCGAHDDDHPQAIERFQREAHADKSGPMDLVDPHGVLFGGGV